jgi:hypothetical protein
MKLGDVSSHMAIVLQLDKSGHPTPEITCDGCGGLIKDHQDGVAILEASGAEPEKILRPIFLCRGCEEKTEQPGKQRRKMAIDQFLVQVAHNVHLMPNDLEAVGRRMMAETKNW